MEVDYRVSSKILSTTFMISKTDKQKPKVIIVQISFKDDIIRINL